MALVDSIISAESGGRQDLGNPRSSAFGPGQFTRGTWLQMIARYRPDLVQDHDERYLLALRGDPQLSRQMTQAYADENGAMLRRHGFEPTPGNTYLAHFAGPSGALNVLRADPAAPLNTILDDKAIKANPFLTKMTAGDLRSWANAKMGVPMPPQGIPLAGAPQPQASPPVAAAAATAPPAVQGASMPEPDAMARARAALADGLQQAGSNPFGMVQQAAAMPALPMAPKPVLPPATGGFLPQAALAAMQQGPQPAPQQQQPVPPHLQEPGGTPFHPALGEGRDPQIAGMLDGLMKQILASPFGGDQAAIARQQSFGG